MCCPLFLLLLFNHLQTLMLTSLFHYFSYSLSDLFKVMYYSTLLATSCECFKMNLCKATWKEMNVDCVKSKIYI